MIAAANAGELDALVVGGVDPFDLADPKMALAALDKTFVVSLELRASAVTERADVVFPIAPVVEKSGTFLDWEGRERRFAQVLGTATSLSDLRVLAMLAEAVGSSLGFVDVAEARAELEALGGWDGTRASAPSVTGSSAGAGVRLATWRQLLDLGTLQSDEEHLAGTARASVARMSAATAAANGISSHVQISAAGGAITLPVLITDMADDVVWVPENSVGSQVRRSLGVGNGAVVTITGKAGA